MDAQTTTTIADLAVGDAGVIVGGKFDGRTFTIRNHGTQGRLTMVNWTEQATIGSIWSNTVVTTD
jgi:hypothetical protein